MLFRNKKMTRDEYETELKHLYGEAMKRKDFRLAFDILEAGQAICVKGVMVRKVPDEEA